MIALALAARLAMLALVFAFTWRAGALGLVAGLVLAFLAEAFLARAPAEAPERRRRH